MNVELFLISLMFIFYRLTVDIIPHRSIAGYAENNEVQGVHYEEYGIKINTETDFTESHDRICDNRSSDKGNIDILIVNSAFYSRDQIFLCNP